MKGILGFWASRTVREHVLALVTTKFVVKELVCTEQIHVPVSLGLWSLPFRAGRGSSDNPSSSTVGSHQAAIATYPGSHISCGSTPGSLSGPPCHPF